MRSYQPFPSRKREHQPESTQRFSRKPSLAQEIDKDPLLESPDSERRSQDSGVHSDFSQLPVLGAQLQDAATYARSTPVRLPPFEPGRAANPIQAHDLTSHALQQQGTNDLPIQRAATDDSTLTPMSQAILHAAGPRRPATKQEVFDHFIAVLRAHNFTYVTSGSDFHIEQNLGQGNCSRLARALKLAFEEILGLDDGGELIHQTNLLWDLNDGFIDPTSPGNCVDEHGAPVRKYFFRFHTFLAGWDPTTLQQGGGVYDTGELTEIPEDSEVVPQPDPFLSSKAEGYPEGSAARVSPIIEGGVGRHGGIPSVPEELEIEGEKHGLTYEFRHCFVLTSVDRPNILLPK